MKADRGSRFFFGTFGPGDADVVGTFGLGDAVYIVAHPIAKAIDTVARTNLSNCIRCKRTRKSLNRFALFKTRRLLDGPPDPDKTPRD
jgi:hypothetical protein